MDNAVDDKIFCVDWLTNKRFEALFSVRTIVRGPHHRKPLYTQLAGFEPAQNLSSGFLIKVVQQ